MTFKKLREHLPTKRVIWMQFRRAGMMMRIDVAGALYRCAYQDSQKYYDGDYSVAWAHWQRLAQQLKRVGLLDAELVFDGKDNPHKSPERRRRDDKAAAARQRIDDAVAKGEAPTKADLEATLRNEPLFMKGCLDIAVSLGFKCSVQPTEADAYVAGVDCDGKVISVSQDGDMALWSLVWIGPVDWVTGQAIIIDFESFSEDDVDNYPLVGAYLNHGRDAIILGAAFAGCDFVSNSATHGIGWASYISAVTSIPKTKKLTPSAVTAALKKQRPDAAKGDATAKKKYWAGVTGAMNAVKGAVSGATFYSPTGSVRSAKGEIEPASNEALAHMQGRVNSRTGLPFEGEEEEEIDALDPSQLTMPSQVQSEQVEAAMRLGTHPTTEQARKYIIAIGGSTRAMGKALSSTELVALALQYKAAAEEVPFARVDRSESGGLFHTIDVSCQTSNWTTIKGLLNSNKKEIDKINHMNARAFLSDFSSAYGAGDFVTGDAVTRTSPEWSEQLLSHFYAPLASGAESTKAMRDSVKRATQMNDLLYHAVARAKDGDRFFMSMKLRASMKKDQKSEAAAKGDQKDKLPYMTLMEVLVKPTTAEEDGHDLGRAWCVGRTFCSCPAGLGLCEHKGTGLVVQSLHWDADRPEPQPTHFHKKCWGKHGRKRKAGVVAPLEEVSVGPSSSDAKQFRQCRDTGAKLDFDVANMGLMRKKLKPAKMRPHCELLRKKNAKKEAKKKKERSVVAAGGSESDSDGGGGGGGG